MDGQKLAERICRESRRSQALVQEDSKAFMAAVQKIRFERRYYLRRNAADARSRLRLLSRSFSDHVAREEKEIFPRVRRMTPALLPLQNLLSLEHREFADRAAALDRGLAALEKKTPADPAAPARKIYSDGIYLVCLVRSHFAVEGDGFYRMLRERLSSESRPALLSEAS
ncbi:MAG TPA: hypothetical protein VL404_09960 [Candidatus Eisenbacteria bacterium]|nr:hypothetical protein [Candidatus Eisenbacteria bacterium]